ncbi:MAG: EamA family transporter, partial [Eggerthellaceae bacterium]|nr:EamA family transporter [Eggerthellaceae bacterium]
VLLAAFLVLFKREFLRVRLRDLGMFAVMGVVGVTVCNYIYTVCLAVFGASVTVVLLNTTPIFVTILGVLFLHEQLTLRKVAALVLAGGGCTLGAGILGGHISFSPRALAIGLSGGFIYSFYSLAGRKASQLYATPTVALYTFFFCAVACVFLVDVPETFSLLVVRTDVLPHFAMIVLFTFLPYFTYTYGLQHLEAGQAAILVLVEVVVGNLIGIFVFGEPFSIQKLAGMLLVLGGLVLLNTGDKRRERGSGLSETAQADAAQAEVSGPAALSSEMAQAEGHER